MLTEETLEDGLARFAHTLMKYNLSSEAFGALFEGKPARLLNGAPLTGFEDAVWERTGDGDWELRRGGARLARLRAQEAGAWAYEVN